MIFEPPADEGWVEALITGLSFDLAGLSPKAPDPMPELAHEFGFDARCDATQWDPVYLRPGPHLAGGENMLPVVRAAVALAGAVAADSGAQAVAWLPARTVMSPGYFAEATRDWLARGPFPGLGLTALAQGADGALTSEGLTFFVGQEIRVAADAGATPGARAKLALRLIDRLVESGALTTAIPLTGPDGEALVATPSSDGAVVTLAAAT